MWRGEGGTCWRNRRRRNTVERCPNKLKDHRAAVTGYDERDAPPV
jgi:hypothetical protein